MKTGVEPQWMTTYWQVAADNQLFIHELALLINLHATIACMAWRLMLEKLQHVSEQPMKLGAGPDFLPPICDSPADKLC